MQNLTQEQALAKLRDAVARCGGQAELARQHSISRALLNMTLSGKTGGEKVFRAVLGLERVRDLWTVAK